MYRNLILILLPMLLLLSCRKKDDPTPSQPGPAAGFSYSIRSCSLPYEVQFTNKSIRYSSLEWDFGDGSTSTGTNPVHVYTQTGVFTVKLTARGDGRADVFSAQIDLQDSVQTPTLNISFTGTKKLTTNVFAFPSKVTFNPGASFADEIFWVIGTDTFFQEKPVQVFQDTATVVATAFAICGSDTVTSGQTLLVRTPVIYVTAAQLHAIPGGPFDPDGSPPDLYIELRDAYGVTFGYTDHYFNPVSLPLYYEYFWAYTGSGYVYSDEVALPIDPDETIFLYGWDFDGGIDDPAGWLTFEASTLIGDENWEFSSSQYFAQSGLEVLLYLEYGYQ